MKYLTVFSDASWHDSGAGGYAFFVRDESSIIKRSFRMKWKAGSSVEVEVFAMCHAILHAINNIPHEEGDVVVAQTDCLAVVHQFEEKPTAATESILRCLEAEGLGLRFKHVKAHTGADDRRSYVNRWCDISARREQRRVRG